MPDKSGLLCRPVCAAYGSAPVGLENYFPLKRITRHREDGLIARYYLRAVATGAP